ncbi:MAG: ABC transporter ATP-binding protein [Acidimicrobiales bacterium]
MVELAIRTELLVKDYGSTRAVDRLDLEVRRGEVFGFLGPNGSGKTTTIRLLLDLIRPTSGRAEVLGLDPQNNGVALRERIGYLPGDFLVEGRQSAVQLLTFLGNLRGGVAAARIEELAQRLDLDLDRKIRELSKGNRQKVGVIQAFMHEPELLVLDEPTSGLDPFLQHEFAALVRETTAAGRTVFLSSHVLSEVQEVADRVAVIREGALVTVEDVEDLLARSGRRVEILFDRPVDEREFFDVPGVSQVRAHGSSLHCRLEGRADDLVKRAALHTVVTLSVEQADLEDLFFGYYDRSGEVDDAD